ncbi:MULTISPECIES: type I-E CRISPR-associated protein Cse2/CasB [unclassified Streptomyces]|uniref:type I-E CRISPR-associated protein Cse2/CasB n=1 Tax=unclassified Streptomyces TaxID=2593676 RepID=UPI001EFD539C|nr:MULTISPECIES: type I-E CRISPR-associated protein Cse2/CasB [unclassified Streptomyces]
MSTTPVPPAAEVRPSEEFVAAVVLLCREKRAQSDLRTGLGRPVERCNRFHRHVVRLLPDDGMHYDAKRAHYAVAALIAARPRVARDADEERAGDTEPVPQWRKRPNLGASLAMAVNAGVIKPNSAEGDLHLFARQSSDAFHVRLPALTRHLLTGGIAVDWAVLLEDLTWWNRDRDRIATRWLESYFRTVNPEATDGTVTDSDSHEENN